MGEKFHTVEANLSDEAIEYADQHIGIDVDIGAVVVPPVPRDSVADVVDEYDGDVDGLKGHLFDITDIALAANHASDPTLNHGIDDAKYNSCDDTVAELKIAHGALISSFNREIERLAQSLDIDTDERADLTTAIRETLGCGDSFGTRVDSVEFTELDGFADSEESAEARDSQSESTDYE